MAVTGSRRSVGEALDERGGRVVFLRRSPNAQLLLVLLLAVAASASKAEGWAESTSVSERPSDGPKDKERASRSDSIMPRPGTKPAGTRRVLLICGRPGDGEYPVLHAFRDPQCGDLARLIFLAHTTIRPAEDARVLARDRRARVRLGQSAVVHLGVRPGLGRFGPDPGSTCRWCTRCWAIWRG